MLATGYFSSGFAFGNVGGSFVWFVEVSYQLEDSSASKTGTIPITYPSATTKLDTILDLAKAAIINDASSKYGVTLAVGDIAFFYLNQTFR